MAEKQIKTIGVLTSGGDAPGMNAAIRAVVRRGLSSGLNVKGIYKGYNGLLNEEIVDMSARDVSDTIERGGSLLTLESIRSVFREQSTWILHVPSIRSDLIQL